MFKWLFETFNHDYNLGGGIGTLKPDPALGLTVGKERPLYRNTYEDADDLDTLEDVYIDDASYEAIGKKLSSPVYKTDPKRSDVGVGSLRLHLEEESNHTTKARKGISPFKTKLTGPTLGSRTIKLTTGPGRKTGSQYGSSRAPIDYEINDPLMFGSNPKDKMEISFLKHQKRIKNIHKLIKTLENNKKSGYLDK